jgi:low affinity Fe/Cu permease
METLKTKTMVKNMYGNTERMFEKLTSSITSILGNSISFIVALVMVIFWWSNNSFSKEGIHQTIGDIIFGTTFLSLFVIQKSFNRFSALMHLKINELIASHEPASNAVIHAEVKTEKEISELAKEYSDLAELAAEKAVEQVDTKEKKE